MEELSLHILDIAENSTRAGATLVRISVSEEPEHDRLVIRVADNGCGMEEDLLRTVRDPFTTTRTTRKVGLGLPLLEDAAIATGGCLRLCSTPGRGTELEAVFGYSHIDRLPLGDLAATIVTLVQCHADIDFIYEHRYAQRAFTLDTRTLRETLDGVPLGTPAVLFWIRDYINENLQQIYMEV